MVRIRDGAVCRTTLGWLLMMCLALAAPGFAQEPKINPPDSGPKRGDRGGPLELVVVNGATKKTWQDADLRRIAASQSGPRWTNRDKEDVLTIPLWALLKEGGVSRDATKTVQLHSRGKLLATFQGKDLEKMDQLVLRTGDTQNRPWRLSSTDPKDRNPYGRAVVRRIEVTTAAAK